MDQVTHRAQLRNRLLHKSDCNGSGTDCQSWQPPQEKEQPPQTFLASHQEKVSPGNRLSGFNSHSHHGRIPKEQCIHENHLLLRQLYPFQFLQHKVNELIPSNNFHHSFALSLLTPYSWTSTTRLHRKQAPTRSDISRTRSRAESLLTTGYPDK